METPENPQDKTIDTQKEETIVKLGKIPQAFNDEIDRVLESSQNREKAIEEFDRIMLKLMRFVRYSINKNASEETDAQESKNEEKQNSVIDEQETSNMIRRFINRFRGKLLSEEAMSEGISVEQQSEESNVEEEKKNAQEEIFDYVCLFINSFMVDQNISKVHNNIPKTTLEKYSKKSIGEQLFQNLYLRHWGKDGIGEGGSCSYRTILFYHFFNKLKEAGLDLNISFFRYKNVDDEILQEIKANRHSGLIINFQGEDYMVDNEGLMYSKDRSVVKPLSTAIDDAHAHKRPDVADFFEEFKKKEEKNEKIKFFDKEDEFIEHYEQYPPDYKILFYVKFPDKEEVEKISFVFGRHNFGLKINGIMHEFYLKDNKLQFNNLTKNLIKNLYVKRVGDKFIAVSEEDREMLRKYFGLIKSKINTDALYKHYRSGGDWKAERLECGGNVRLAYGNTFY